jgi:hypothetical protein
MDRARRRVRIFLLLDTVDIDGLGGVSVSVGSLLSCSMVGTRPQKREFASFGEGEIEVSKRTGSPAIPLPCPTLTTLGVGVASFSYSRKVS